MKMASCYTWVSKVLWKATAFFFEQLWTGAETRTKENQSIDSMYPTKENHPILIHQLILEAV